MKENKDLQQEREAIHVILIIVAFLLLNLDLFINLFVQVGHIGNKKILVQNQRTMLKTAWQQFGTQGSLTLSWSKSNTFISPNGVRGWRCDPAMQLWLRGQWWAPSDLLTPFLPVENFQALPISVVTNFKYYPAWVSIFIVYFMSTFGFSSCQAMIDSFLISLYPHLF